MKKRIRKDMDKYDLYCDKHGNVTNSVVLFDYEVTDPSNGEIKKIHDLYCVECINDFLKELQNTGKLGKITAKVNQNI